MKKLIKQMLREDLEHYHSDNAKPESNTFEIGLYENNELRFNDGRFNKDGVNTIYLNDEPIIDFGVGGIGSIEINNKTISNALYLKGGYNAAIQGQGYGTLGINYIFSKLPKIENIILQCFDTACPFWFKKGGEEIEVKKLDGGHTLRTLNISRNNFK